MLSSSSCKLFEWIAVKFIWSNISKCLSEIFKLYAPLGKWVYLSIAWLKECIRRVRFRRTIQFVCIVSLHSLSSSIVQRCLECILFDVGDLYKVGFDFIFYAIVAADVNNWNTINKTIDLTWYLARIDEKLLPSLIFICSLKIPAVDFSLSKSLILEELIGVVNRDKFPLYWIRTLH